jgi:hypothetical protein
LAVFQPQGADFLGIKLSSIVRPSINGIAT